MRKERLDVLLVEKGYFSTREKAKAAIMAGLVSAAGERCDKPGTKFPENVAITVKGELHPYVSRGGLKLEKALKTFGINLSGKIVMDIGASTGGFTDCALKNGAKHVYAIDVGYGQLDWSLRQDERVTVMERTNFRHMKVEEFPYERPQAATIDVSFISLKLILPVLHSFLVDQGEVIALVKPQFEAGKENVGKNGIVRDPHVHEEVLRDILSFSEEMGFCPLGLAFSPITGGEGNIEFLFYAVKNGSCQGPTKDEWNRRITNVVREAHETL